LLETSLSDLLIASTFLDRRPDPVSHPFRRFFHAWLVFPLLALAFLFSIHAVRRHRVERTSALVQEPPPTDASSATGYAGGTRVLIVPEHNAETYQWIAQTQQMVSNGEWRVHRIDYENAPFGRDVHATSVYRWWLGAIASIERVFSGQPIGQAVERAALYSDPLLQLILLIATAAFVAWRFGARAAAFASVAVATAYPFTAEFVPGLSDERGLSRILAFWSVLLLLAAMPTRAGLAISAAAARRWFFAAGVVGAVGIWTSAAGQIPIIVGLWIGGLLVPWVIRSKGTPASGAPVDPLPWRSWALGGALATLLAYLFEYYPAHLGDWELHSIHPLFGIGWIGLGETLALSNTWIRRGKVRPLVAEILRLAFAIVCIASVPVAMKLTHSLGFLQIDLPSLRLVRFVGGAAASQFFEWIYRDGFSAPLCATLLPLLLLVPAIWLLIRRSAAPGGRTAIAIALGPVVLALGFACRQLSWWSAVDATLLALLVAVVGTANVTPATRVRTWVSAVMAALVLLPGAIQILPARSSAANALNESEVYGLVERDLARWLAAHHSATAPVMLAPNNVDATLHFYGSLRGLGGLSWENEEGVGAAIRIVSASTPEEAKELIDRRGITHIVIPSWDSYLDVYARMGMGQLDGTFLQRLHLWQLPPWLRPVAYQLPKITGFEGQSLTIFQVVEDQDDAAALSRVAEYFVEMGELDRAALVGQALRRFPADIGALVARAQVELARSDSTAFGRTVDQLKSRMVGGADRTLPWDRRVGLAVVFARAKETELAREQVRRCFADADEFELRNLSTGALYRLLVLGRAFNFTPADPSLRQLALDLLPAEFRTRL